LNKLKFTFFILIIICVTSVFGETVITEANLITGNKTLGTVTLEGNAHIKYADINIYGDYIKFNKINGTILAQGNVKAKLSHSTITGDEITYLLDTDKAIVKNGTLVIEEFRFKADKIETENQDYFYLENAKFTSCPKECDKWFFNAKSIKLRREGYATFKSLKFEINGKTYLYLPVFIYPAKLKRAAGFLIPSFGSSSKYGFKFNQEIFIPIKTSQDITIEADYYAKAGTGLGLEYRISRTKNEFGRFRGYSINDKLKKQPDGTSTKRAFADMAYSYHSSNLGIDLDLFEGHDFDIVRDFNFDKYSFAMRQFYTNFSFKYQITDFYLELSLNRRNIIFQNDDQWFSSLPSLSIHSKNIFFLNRAISLNATTELIDSPIVNNNINRSSATLTTRTNYKFNLFNLSEKLSLKFTNYSSNNILQSNFEGQFSYKLISPTLIKKTNSYSHKLNLFSEFGYRSTTKEFPETVFDMYDYINPDGLFVQAGVESSLFINNKTVTGGFYIEKTFGENYYHNEVYTEKTSDYAPIKGYITLPFKNFSLGIQAAYDSSINQLDTLMVSANITNSIRLSYLKAYTYGVNDKRDSIIVSFSKQINDKWSTDLTLDYDFTISDLRYQVYSITYYNKCIGFSLKYLNNTYTIRDDNQVTFSLILKDIGEFLKYKIGL